MNKVFWWRFGLALFLVLLQVSLINILLPTVHAPILIVNAIMAIILSRGFRSGLWESISIVVLFDLFRTAAITYFVPYGIFVAYVTSFISQRFIFEHRGGGALLLASLSSVFGVLYVLVVTLSSNAPIFVSNLVILALLFFVSFYPIFFMIQRFEAWFSHQDFESTKMYRKI